MLEMFSKLEQERLTESEKRIIDFIIGNQPEVVEMTLTTLADKLYVSNSSIIRLCKKIGLDGFNELKYQISKELNNDYSKNLWIQKVISQPVEEFKENLTNIDKNEFEKITDLLISKEHIYIFGRGINTISAEYMASMLSSIDRYCMLVLDLHLAIRLSKNISKDSVFLFITSQADFETFSSIFKNIQRNEAISILITSNSNSSLIPISDYYLISNDSETNYKGVDIDDRLGILSILQLLIENISIKFNS